MCNGTLALLAFANALSVHASNTCISTVCGHDTIGASIGQQAVGHRLGRGAGRSSGPRVLHQTECLHMLGYSPHIWDLTTLLLMPHGHSQVDTVCWGMSPDPAHSSTGRGMVRGRPSALAGSPLCRRAHVLNHVSTIYDRYSELHWSFSSLLSVQLRILASPGRREVHRGPTAAARAIWGITWAFDLRTCKG